MSIYEEKAIILNVEPEEVKKLFWYWLYGGRVPEHMIRHMRDIAVEFARDVVRERGRNGVSSGHK